MNAAERKPPFREYGIPERRLQRRRRDNKALQRLSVRPGYPDGRVLEGAGVVPGAAFRAQDERGGFRKGDERRAVHVRRMSAGRFLGNDQ